MNIISFIIAISPAIASAIAVFIIGYLDAKEKKKLRWVLIVCGLLILFASIFNAIQQENDAGEIKKLNKELSEKSDEILGYTSGGKNNKPLLEIMFKNLPDGSYDTTFAISNVGNYPFNNIIYEIQDYYTMEYNFLKRHNLNGYKYLGKKGIEKLLNYESANINYTKISGSTENLPTRMSREVYYGKIASGMKKIFFPFTLTWNNENYHGFYVYAMDDTGAYKLVTLSINRTDETPVKNLTEFFPLVSERFQFWKDASLAPQQKQFTRNFPCCAHK